MGLHCWALGARGLGGWPLVWRLSVWPQDSGRCEGLRLGGTAGVRLGTSPGSRCIPVPLSCPVCCGNRRCQLRSRAGTRCPVTPSV